VTSIRSNDGTEIGYDRRGTGPPLIIVAGATAYRAIAPSEDQLAELLAADFTVFRYDRRGRGESGDAQSYAVEREIEDLGALVDEAGGSAIALGFSSGAVLALEAAEAGLPLTGLALYEPPFIVDDSRPAMPDDYVSRLRELVAADRRADASEYFLQQAVGLPQEVVAGMRQNGALAAVDEVAHTIANDGEIMGDTIHGRPLPADRWKHVSAPVLVLDGGDSPPSMHSAAEALTELLPGAERRTLPGQTHSAEPAVLAPVLREHFG
jgi:pimeloyl-ACP methyl ester carboxylesterase